MRVSETLCSAGAGICTYRIPRASLALTREGVRHPGVLIGPVPDGDANTSLDSLAGSDDGLIVLLLLGEERRGGRERHADIELGDGNLDTSSRERRELRLEVGRDLADDEMALESDTIERHAGGLEGLDEVEQRRGLRAGVLNVVLVDVELGVRIGRTRCLKGDADVGGTEGVVEDVRAPCTVIVERL